MSKRSSNPNLDSFVVNVEYAFNRGVDFQNRVIQLTEDIDEGHFEFLDSAMTTLERLNRKTITIKINSYGGDVYTALGMIGRIKESKCMIHTKGYGKIMSASTAILAAGHKRGMSRFAEFMHHEASYDVSGKHSEISHEVGIVQKQEERWAEVMEEFTGKSKDFWMRAGVGINYYLDAARCLELNIVDEVF